MNTCYRNFIEQIQDLFGDGEYGKALFTTGMMVKSLREEGNDWAKYRIPICGLLFGAFQFRADEYDATVVKDDAEEEIEAFEQSPCVKISDSAFMEVLAEEKNAAVNTAKEAFICLRFPRRCRKSERITKETTSKAIIGFNREPRRNGRKKRSDEVVEEACSINDDEELEPELDEEGVCIYWDALRN